MWVVEVIVKIFICFELFFFKELGFLVYLVCLMISKGNSMEKVEVEKISFIDIQMKDVGGRGNYSVKVLMLGGLLKFYRKDRNFKKQGKFCFRF